MDDFKITKEEQKIIDSAKEVVLSLSEKNEIKNKIISYTNSHPITNPKKISVFTKFDFIYHKSTYLIPALVVVLLVVGLNFNQNNTGQITSIENTSDNISPSETFDMRAFSVQMVSDEDVSEPKIEDGVVMMMASIEAPTSTEYESEDENETIGIFEKIKNRVKAFFKYFVDTEQK